MCSILVSYDLIGTDESSSDYRRLIKHLKEDYNNWANVLYSAFVIKTTQSSKQVRDNLLRHTDDNDRLFVCELTGVAAWHNVICMNDWLMKNL